MSKRGGSPCTTYRSGTKDRNIITENLRIKISLLLLVPGTTARTLNPTCGRESFQWPPPSMLCPMTKHRCAHRSPWRVRDQCVPAIRSNVFFVNVSICLRIDYLLLTAIYGLQPASFVLAMESTNWPEIPKSHNLMSPRLCKRILLGFTSRWMILSSSFR